MRKTATHLLSSPNPAMLEMRILANYGADKRFAFLRGRWTRSWKLIKAQSTVGTEKNRLSSPRAPGGLGGLEGYGDSDGDSGDEGDGETKEKVKSPEHEPIPEARTDKECLSEAKLSEEEIKAARRAKVKEWAKNRRALKAGPG